MPEAIEPRYAEMFCLRARHFTCKRFVSGNPDLRRERTAQRGPLEPIELPDSGANRAIDPVVARTTNGKPRRDVGIPGGLPRAPRILSPRAGAIRSQPWLRVTGVAAPQAEIDVEDGDRVVAHAGANTRGRWSVDLTELAPGPHTLVARVRDDTGSSCSEACNVVIRPAVAEERLPVGTEAERVPAHSQLVEEEQPAITDVLAPRLQDVTVAPAPESTAPATERIEDSVAAFRAETAERTPGDRKPPQYVAPESNADDRARREPVQPSSLRRRRMLLWLVPVVVLGGVGAAVVEGLPAFHPAAAPHVQPTVVPSGAAPAPAGKPTSIASTHPRPVPTAPLVGGQPPHGPTANGATTTYWKFSSIPHVRGTIFLGLYNPKKTAITADVRIFFGRQVQKQHVSLRPEGTIKLALNGMQAHSGGAGVTPLTVQTASALVPVVLVKG